MKKILLIISFFIYSTSFASKRTTIDIQYESFADTTVIPQILALPLSNFIGKPLDSLLLALPAPYTGQGFKPARIGYIKGFYRVYGEEEFNHCAIEIFFDTIQFLPVPNYNQKDTWNMSLAKKEIISFIKITKNTTSCVYGCGNPKYVY